MAIVSSDSSSCRNNILEAVTQTGEDCRLPWTTLSEAATVDLPDNSKPWNFDAIAGAFSSLIKSQEDRILSSVPMELIDPELQDALPSSTSSPQATASSVEDAPKTILTPKPGLIESIVAQPLCGNQGVGDQPCAEICEVEALLAKWKQGKTSWYLVKWEGFPDEENMWVKKDGIDLELVKAFEAIYQGNHLGVRLLKKRVRRGKVEYLVEWKGRPKRENSWEKEATISRERIMEFEAS
ncbi:hypothetical protein B0J14DRAFT_703182 [Halenospora varia]|nr:hypothetical protein B0J14DRAFT_703182 [Halenospora varia]